MAVYKRAQEKSKKAIQDAFVSLFKERKEIDLITVQDIILKANVAKSTFYNYYSNLNDLYCDFENAQIKLFSDALDAYIGHHKEEALPYIFKTIDILKQDEEFYRTIFNSNVATYYLVKMKKIITEKLLKDLISIGAQKDNKSLYVEISFITNGVIGLFGDYFAKRINISLDEIGVLVYQAISKLF